MNLFIDSVAFLRRIWVGDFFEHRCVSGGLVASGEEWVGASLWLIFLGSSSGGSLAGTADLLLSNGVLRLACRIRFRVTGLLGFSYDCRSWSCFCKA
ncbi:unnamed protein product [Arabidopsis lyrata]|nr:unnamed protein product [Arabidopsis lyrata]